VIGTPASLPSGRIALSSSDSAESRAIDAAISSTGRILRVNGVDLNVVIEGEGPDVLLLHGFPDDHDVWREQIPILVGAGYRVIAPDQRGCGESGMSAARGDYAVANLVADVVGLLDTLGIAKVRLVAHDWGAVVGWQLCLQHPERIDRYVALSVGHPLAYARASFEQKLMGWYVLFFQIPRLAERALRWRNWWLFRRLTRFEAEAPNWIAKLGRRGRLTAALNSYRANLGLISPGHRPHAHVPVMGVWSDGDLFLAESQMLATQKLVDADWRYERIPGANHWMQLTAADRVNDLLLDYLR
jgi:pimeloyl-ACP methyl ester carboxylesterase